MAVTGAGVTALTGAKGSGAVLGPAGSKYREVGGAGTRQGFLFWRFRFPPKAFYHRPRRQALWPQCSPPGLGGRVILFHTGSVRLETLDVNITAITRSTLARIAARVGTHESLTCEVVAGGLDFRVLADTGAGVTIFSEDFLSLAGTQSVRRYASKRGGGV